MIGIGVTFSGNDHFFIISFIFIGKANHDDVILAGVCTKQTCFLASGEQDLLAGASLQHHSTSSFCCFYL